MVKAQLTFEQLKSIWDTIQLTKGNYLIALNYETNEVYASQAAINRFSGRDFSKDSGFVLVRGIHPLDKDKVEHGIMKCVAGEFSSFSVAFRMYVDDTTIIWLEAVYRILETLDAGKIIFAHVAELGRKPLADNITGLRMMESFRKNVSRLLVNRPEAINYMLRIDIDNFKEINERYGTEAGDRVLKELADCIIDTVDPTVDIYRLSGDEFMIVDYTTPRHLADPYLVYNLLCERVLSNIKGKGYREFHTLSAGVLVMDFTGKKIDDIIVYSEFALEDAKNKGKNRISDFDEEEYKKYLEKIEIRKCMRNHVTDDCEGFEVYYQPIVSAKTKQVIGAEALLRFKDEKFGMIPPSVTIPILEESGMIIPVGKHVLDTAIRQSVKWQKKIPEFHININLSYVQLLKSKIIDDIDCILEETGIDPNTITLEVTESGYIETDNRIMETFNRLRDRKLNLAIDDFGTGFSNIRYLNDISANVVKFDRDFTARAVSEKYDFTVISHITDLAHTIGSGVCVEGIENDEEMEAISSICPDMYQGYKFGRPVPASEFEKSFL